MSYIKIEATFSPITIREDVPLSKELTDLAAMVLKEQLSNGIDATGKQHLDAKGRPLNFRQSGQLLDTMQTEPGSIIFDEDYAEHVNARAPIDGLAPEYLTKLEQLATETVERLLIVEE